MFEIFLLTIGFVTEVLESLLEVNLNLIEGFDGFLPGWMSIWNRERGGKAYAGGCGEPN
jgi:hypothetical protein